MKNFHQWNTPSKSFAEALLCALEGIELYNYKMIVDYRYNLDHQNPLTQTSDNLNNPFNWKSTASFHRTPEEQADAIKRAKNDTERDLIENWEPVFSEPEAIELYMKDGTVTAGLFKGMGRSFQVRRKDIVKFLRENGEAERADLFENPKFFNAHLWTAKNIADFREPAEGNTYAVYFAKNEENLPTEELKKILDQSIKAILLKENL